MHSGKAASSTALLIAASLSVLSRKPGENQVPPESRQLGDWLLQNYSWLTRAAFLCLDQSWFHWLADQLEAQVLPNITPHYLARKLTIEALFRQQSQCDRLIVLGAGFDTLALRMTKEFAALTAFEVDHPGTQLWKLKATEACGLSSSRVRFVPQDLALSDWPTLKAHKNEEKESGFSFWIAEGLLMYLTAAKVAELFREIHQRSNPGSKFLFTFMEPGNDGKIGFRRSSRTVHRWLARRGEPFTWGIRRSELAEFVSRFGFRLLKINSATTAEVDQLNVGEYLALTEVIR